jgi:hypothetical protein
MPHLVARLAVSAAPRAAGSRACVRGLLEKAIAGRPRPARWLPRPRATRATRGSKTPHPTNDRGCGPRSIGPPTADQRSRRPLTELCCSPVPPLSGACSVWLSKHDAVLLTKHDAVAAFPCQKGGAFSARNIHARTRSRRNTATALILRDLRAGAPQHDPPHRPQPVTQQHRATEGAAPVWGRTNAGGFPALAWCRDKRQAGLNPPPDGQQTIPRSRCRRPPPLRRNRPDGTFSTNL